MELMIDYSRIDPKRFGFRFGNAYIASKDYGPDKEKHKVRITRLDQIKNRCHAEITKDGNSVFAREIALGEIFALKQSENENLETILNLEKPLNLKIRTIPADIKTAFDAGKPVPIAGFLHRAIQIPLLLQAKAICNNRYSHRLEKIPPPNAPLDPNLNYFDCSASSGNQLGLREFNAETGMGRFMQRVMDYISKGYLEIIATNCSHPTLYSAELPLKKLVTGDVIIYADNDDITGFRHTVTYLFHNDDKKTYVASQEGIGGEFRVTFEQNIVESYQWPQFPYWMVVRPTEKHPHKAFIGGGE